VTVSRADLEVIGDEHGSLVAGSGFLGKAPAAAGGARHAAHSSPGFGQTPAYPMTPSAPPQSPGPGAEASPAAGVAAETFAGEPLQKGDKVRSAESGLVGTVRAVTGQECVVAYAAADVHGKPSYKVEKRAALQKIDD
jgi:hypothetical protein